MKRIWSWRSIPISSISLVLLGSYWSSGCNSNSDAKRMEHPLGPTVVALEHSIVVKEEDSAYIARPSFMALSPSGTFLVTDAYFDHIAVVERDGTLGAPIGRQGTGPGELEGASFSFVLDDSTLVVWDSRNGTLNSFRLESGEFVEQVSNPGFPRDAAIMPDGVWLGALNMSAGTGLVRWKVDDASFDTFLKIPQSYAESGPLAGIFNGVMVEPDREHLLVTFAGSDTVQVVSLNGSVVDRFAIPRARRRGVPTDIVERMATARDQPTLIGMLSSVRTLHQLPSGYLAILHYDISSDQQSIRAEAFISLLDRTSRRVCIDGEVPMGDESLPVPAFRGDTLFILDQKVDLQSSSARARIRSFLIDPTTCEWVAI